jgi:hypothetical protein
VSPFGQIFYPLSSCLSKKRQRKNFRMQPQIDPTVGPRGGDLTNPKYRPAARTAHFNGETLPNGGLGLHFTKDYDTAANGKVNEQPWHRMAAYMLNAGRTNSEIAVAAGVAPITVSNLRAQRWFQELCATIANNFGEEIVGATQSYGLEAVENIHDIATDLAAPARTRLAANQILLEHAHGKPVQKTVAVVQHGRLSPEDEMTEIQAELQRLRSLSPAPPLADRKEN